MPIVKVGDKFRWGEHGHLYRTRAGAAKQARAAYANGYVGKSLSEVAKAVSEDRKRGAAIGVGSTLAAGGLVGGGLPGLKANSLSLGSVRSRDLSRVKRARRGLQATRGGIFGYREDAHRRFMERNKESMASARNDMGDKLSARVNNQDAHLHGFSAGKQVPERQIVRTMRRGRLVSNAALVGGLGLAAAGASNRIKRDKVAKAKDPQDRTGATATLAAGGTAAVGAQAGGRALQRQGRKWAARNKAHLEAAERITPSVGGFETRKTKYGVPDYKPYTHPSHTARPHAWDLNDNTRAQAGLSGHHRGKATQARYFARVYGKNGRAIRRYGTPGAVALTGAGLVGQKYKLARRDEIKPVAKANPFSATARNARRLRRTARYEDRVYQASKPLRAVADAQVDSAAAKLTAAADTASARAGRNIERSGGRLVRRAALGAAGGGIVGIGGGMTLGEMGRQRVKRDRVSKRKENERAERRHTSSSALGYGALAGAAGSAGAGLTAMKWAPPASDKAAGKWIDTVVSGGRKRAEGMGRGKPTASARALGSKPARDLGARYVRTARLMRKYPGRSAAAAFGLKGVGVAAGVKSWHNRDETQSHSEEIARNKFPNRIEKQAGEYPYLLPTIRAEAAGFRRPRTNPISPATFAASSDIMASGQRKLRSINPLFRRRRQRQGMRELMTGAQTIRQGVGEPI